MKTRLALLLLLSLPASSNLRAAEDDHWDNQFGQPGVEGVLVMVQANGTDVYVGGMFDRIGEAITSGIAKWDGSRWHSLGGGIKGNIPVVYSVAFQGNDVYAGGFFTNAGSTSARSLARWNGSSWTEVGGGVNGVVMALVMVENNLFVGGQFTQAGSINARCSSR